MKDDTWADLQRSKAVHGNEPETFRRLYAAVSN